MPIRSILVTGVPRSGTTWLSRQLAHAPGTAMTGREPMNPHRGQYALGGTISSWTRLTDPSAAQERIVRRAYRGHTPRVYGRYGSRQYAAPFPGTINIIKDPFAAVSIACLHEITATVPILVYRHPGAVLASYRRMGWQPDLAELSAALSPDWLPDDQDSVGRLAWFWSAINGCALADLAEIPQALVLSHEELATGGVAAMQRVYQALDLRWTDAVTAAVSGLDRAKEVVNSTGKTLHQLGRTADQVARAWRATVSDAEVTQLEASAGATMAMLAARRLDLSEFSVR